MNGTASRAAADERKVEKMNEKYLQLNQLLHQQVVGWACWFEETDSTNLHAKRLLCEQNMIADQGELVQVGRPEQFPWLILADQQTHGRGRGGNRWWSPKGCLMLTLVFEADSLHTEKNRRSELALVCGLACAEAVESCNVEARVALKWPNDLYSDGKKLGGILIETVSTKHWLVGIGINASLQEENPDHLSAVADANATIESLLQAVCSKVTHRVEDWQSDRWDWHASWQRRCFLNGKTVVLEAGGQEITGVCAGIDPLGQLVILEANGKLSRYASGSIKAFS